ncbi:MAG TPA: universal stress protein [Vicinamibacteria bacterium]|nr:universal stress protein [Vicinamibacteria bacterium]
MIEIRRILCPCDFSVFSERARDHAIGLAQWYEAELSILHVVPHAAGVWAYPPSVTPSTLEPVPRDQVQAELGRFAEPATRAGIPSATVIADGNPAAKIVEQARAGAADLLVLGSHGRSGLERWAVGSVAEKVLRRASCPVMVCGPGERPTPPPHALFKRILCALDFWESSSRALTYALSLAQEANAQLTLLHVIEDIPEDQHRHPGLREYRNLMEAELRARLSRAVPEEVRNWCQPIEMVTEGKAYKQILQIAEEQAADLIVMGVQGRSVLDLLVFGSTTNQVVRRATCPVLTIRS